MSAASQAALAALLTSLGSETNEDNMDMQAVQTNIAALSDRQLEDYKAVVQTRLLVKARQIEKCVYFMEKRQDSAASLPSDTGRHLSQASEAAEAARQQNDGRAVSEAEAAWQLRRTDALHVASQGGCWGWLFAWLSLPRRP